MMMVCGLAGLLLLMTVGGLAVLAPWHLDGVPGFGTAAVDAVAKPGLGGAARSAAKMAAKRGRVDLRRDCPEARGNRIDLEVVVEASGEIRWARPLDRSTDGAGCTARRFKGINSGSRLKQATKVRLQIRP